MSRIGAAPLPSGLITLVVALDNYQVPKDVHKVMFAVVKSIPADKPRVTLNRCFAKLRQANPTIYRKTALWLKQQPVKEHICSCGGYWSLQIWRAALQKLHRGEKAHIAFGMNVGGRPPKEGFTKAFEAAIYAVEAQSSGQAPDLAAAIIDAANIYRARIDEIQKSLQIALGLSSEDRKEMIVDSAHKRI